MNWKTLNAKLIDHLKQEGAIRSKPVEAAFRSTPRHLFVPHESLEAAYTNQVIGLKLDAHGVTISSLSQPTMIAIMLEQLGLRPGQRVLEVGAGTGYNAALMGAIVGPQGRVVTLDIDDDLVENTRANLEAARVENVLAITQDGAHGYPAAAPYDRIILTTSAYDIAPAWVDELTLGGRLLLPLIVASDVQYAIAFDKRDGVLESASHYRCRFVTLRGDYRTPEQGRMFLDDHSYLQGVMDVPPAHPKKLSAWLDQHHDSRPTPFETTFQDISQGLELWLLTRLPHTYLLVSRHEPPPFDPLMVYGDPLQFATLSHITPDGLATVSRRAVLDGDRTPLRIHAYGPTSSAAQSLWDSVLEWGQFGLPTERNVRFGLLRRPFAPDNPSYTVLPKKGFNLVLHWQTLNN